MRTAKTALAAGLLLAATGSSVLAQSAPALVTSDLHHRAGPTSNSPSYGVIRGGTTIEAGPCSGGWCEAYLNGNPGFVGQSYLDFGGPPPGGYYAAPPPPPPVYGPPVYGPPPVIYGPPPYYHDRRYSRRW